MGIESLNLGKKETNPLDILKDLFDNNSITMKTQVSPNQFRALVRAKWLEEVNKPINSRKTGLEILNGIVIPYALELMVSVNRQSREEAKVILSNIAGTLLERQEEEKNAIKKV